MSRISLILSLLLCSFMCLFTSISVKAEETTTVVTPVNTPTGPAQQTTTTVVKDNGTVERKVIVTTTPAAKETITAPTGYTSCFTVDAGWNNDIWVPAHQVCKYSASTEYAGSECTNWDWKSGHWVKTLENY